MIMMSRTCVLRACRREAHMSWTAGSCEAMHARALRHALRHPLRHAITHTCSIAAQLLKVLVLNLGAKLLRVA